MDQQSSRIGRKISHVYCIVRTQDSYVFFFQEASYVEDRPEKSRFSLAANLGWRSTKAITILRQFAEVAKWRGEFSPLATDIEVKNCFSIY